MAGTDSRSIQAYSKIPSSSTPYFPAGHVLSVLTQWTHAGFESLAHHEGYQCVTAGSRSNNHAQHLHNIKSTITITRWVSRWVSVAKQGTFPVTLRAYFSVKLMDDGSGKGLRQSVSVSSLLVLTHGGDTKAEDGRSSKEHCL